MEIVILSLCVLTGLTFVQMTSLLGGFVVTAVIFAMAYALHLADAASNRATVALLSASADRHQKFQAIPFPDVCDSFRA